MGRKHIITATNEHVVVRLDRLLLASKPEHAEALKRILSLTDGFGDWGGIEYPEIICPEPLVDDIAKTISDGDWR